MTELKGKTEDRNRRRDELANRIAKSTAASDIEFFCTPIRGSGKSFGTWYDPSTADDDLGNEVVPLAVEYLELIGMLERSPDDPKLVRPKK